MPRYQKIALSILLVLLLVFGLAAALLATFNWNHARPWLNRQATEMAGRQVQIRGDLAIDWLRPQAQRDGWRGWAPWPRITVNDLFIGNPEWRSGERGMARISHASVLLDPIALLGHVVRIRRLEVDTADIYLERGKDGRANWTFKKAEPASEKPSDWKLDIQDLALKNVKAQVVDASSRLDLQLQLASLTQPPEGEQAASRGDSYGIGWTASGTYNGVDVSGEGRTGAILALREDGKPFPVQGKATVGKTSVELEGSVTRPQSLAALDVNMQLSGDSMSDLLGLIGVALPVTPPYSTKGHLTARLAGEQDVWRYEDFTGKVGKSDLEGTLTFTRSKPRSLLEGQVRSRLLRFKDLGPLIGADTSEVKSAAAEKVASTQPKDKVLPHNVINTDAWSVMDANVHFIGEKILRDKDLPLDHIDARIRLQDKVLSFTPLSFGVAGGTLSNQISLDGRGKEIKATLKTEARHLKLKQLFPGAESMKASFGELHGNANLAGHGNAIAGMLGSADGDIQALVSRGTISHFLLEAAGLNVANLVLLKLFGDEQVILDCMASDFSIKNGLMTPRVFRLETDDAIVDVSGTINLRDETLDLKISPKNKTVRIFTLRSPLYARGSFKSPDVGVEPGPLAMRAGAAVALGVLASPFAALLPLLNVGNDEATHCTSLGDGKRQTGEDKAKRGETPQERRERQKREERESWPSSQAKP